MCSYGDLRLVGRDNAYEGRVEVCIENGRHTVCDDGWISYDAIVVCKQLGNSYTGSKYYTSFFFFFFTGLHSDYIYDLFVDGP